MKRRWKIARAWLAFVWNHKIYPVVVPLVILVAVPVGLAADAGGIAFAQPYFTSAAQGVFPILLVSMFVELASVHERFSRVWGEAQERGVQEGDPQLAEDAKAFHKQISDQAKKMIWLTVVGESAALYALASGNETSFLGVLSALCMATTVYLLATLHLARLAPIYRPRRG